MPDKCHRPKWPDVRIQLSTTGTHAAEFLAPSTAWAAVQAAAATGTEFPDGSVMAKMCCDTNSEGRRTVRHDASEPKPLCAEDLRVPRLPRGRRGLKAMPASTWKPCPTEPVEVPPSPAVGAWHALGVVTEQTNARDVAAYDPPPSFFAKNEPVHALDQRTPSPPAVRVKTEPIHALDEPPAGEPLATRGAVAVRDMMVHAPAAPVADAPRPSPDGVADKLAVSRERAATRERMHALGYSKAEVEAEQKAVWGC
ncbi:hypothetical protein AMAG_20300 [Allomyces macrogynus ATCC 38327]|uniref:Uncharacterized protein n=1 Tax=Allomyces macrogynus (strain ATCC 38327) TaxID=578462 RepID=A0A0L0T7E9_ALLM3|nr:hypothetical protein AMAG_20300 [Allomyces macrogynus ATCC 38327]|eukprot:KNE70621.1 hypothetical protein AMAG_20300 [Allomyces macrogynus ATCC 38327]